MKLELVGRPALPNSQYRKRPSTEFIAVHCSDTRGTVEINAGVIREWHVKERGWIDIGYHYVIRRDGTLEVGRPSWAMGAAVKDWNHNTLSVCLVGGRGPDGKPEDNFTPAQAAVLKALLNSLLSSYPGARVQGHRDFPGVTKACPSFDVKEWWAKAEQNS